MRSLGLGQGLMGSDKGGMSQGSLLCACRFLNRYPQDSVLYFLDINSGRLPNPEYFHRWALP